MPRKLVVVPAPTQMSVELAELMDQVKALTTQVADLEEALDESEQAEVKACDERDEMAEKLADFEKSYAERLALELAELENQVATEQQFVRELDVIRKKDRVTIDRLMSENIRLQDLAAENEKLKEANKQLRAKNKKLNNDLKDLRKLNTDNSVRVAQHHHEQLDTISKLKEENARLREGYEKLKVETNPPPGFAGHNPALVPK